MSVRDRFILEDAEAIAVLGAYWPPVDNLPEDQRMPAAIKKRLALHPLESVPTAEAEVKRLLEWDNNEQQLLLAYGEQMHRNASFMHDAIEAIRSMSITNDAVRANGHIIWRAIEEALNRAAAISRMFDASEKAKDKSDIERRLYRKKLLRLAFGVQSQQFASPARIARNMVEHFEEYLDKEIHAVIDHGGRFGDLACFNTAEARQVMRSSDLLRWYNFETRTIHVFNETIRLDDLDEIFLNIAGVILTTIYVRGRYHIQFAIGARDPFSSR